MLAGNRDQFIILLPFLGLLVEVVGLVAVAHGFRVARVNILLQNDVGFLRFSRILIFQKFLKIPDKILLPRCSETEIRIYLTTYKEICVCARRLRDQSYTIL